MAEEGLAQDGRGTGALVRGLAPADLLRAEELSRQVGFNQTAADWSRLLELGADGCFGAEEDGRLVATTTTTAYGPRLAWIGMVVVDPARRRRGIAGALVEHALDHLEGAARPATVALDATPDGKQVYDRHGFVDQYRIDRLQGVAPTVDPAGIAAVRPMTSADLPEVVRMDALALDAERPALLAGLLRAEPGGAAVVEVGGRLRAFSFRRPGAVRWHVGPVAARDEQAAGLAVRAAVAAIPGEAMEIDVISGPRSAAVAERFSLTPVRSFIRMARGRALPPPEGCWATAAPELG